MCTTALELLTVAEMRRADALAVAGGVPSLTLMENAGRAVADVAEEMLRLEKSPASAKCRVLVLCGSGNNGGDGFVAARHLEARGYDVRVALLGARNSLAGDAAEMARRWDGEVEAADPNLLPAADLVIDALFGAGLSRPLDGLAAEVVAAANDSGRPILSVDVPSGLDGTTGAAAGPVIQATRTVTFFRRKTGQVLLPGRNLCGELRVAGIGIPEAVLDDIKPTIFANAPGVSQGRHPWPSRGGHKYDRGHAVVISGPMANTGAARLGARGALRIGAGLVTLASPRAALATNAAHVTAIMISPFDGSSELASILADARKNAILVGPGLGTDQKGRVLVEVALQSSAAVVIDADGLTSFAASQGMASLTEHRERLVAQIAGRDRAVVMTPHEGEFKRLFPDLAGSKIERARAAAQRTGAIVVLKGPDTVIAAPDGRAAINENAPPWLATAGSGDVLAGFITGLLAQHMPAFEAACAAVWLHGECANRFGPGLIAEDLPEVLPKVLTALYQAR